MPEETSNYCADYSELLFGSGRGDKEQSFIPPLAGVAESDGGDACALVGFQYEDSPPFCDEIIIGGEYRGEDVYRHEAIAEAAGDLRREVGNLREIIRMLRMMEK